MNLFVSQLSKYFGASENGRVCLKMLHQLAKPLELKLEICISITPWFCDLQSPLGKTAKIVHQIMDLTVCQSWGILCSHWCSFAWSQSWGKFDSGLSGFTSLKAIMFENHWHSSAFATLLLVSFSVDTPVVALCCSKSHHW